MLQVERLTAGYAKKAHVLQDLSLSVGEGMRLCIVGPSGCGKSTLLLCMAGLLQPQQGRVRFCGRVVTQTLPQMSIILQDYGLFPWKTVFDNVALPLKLQKRDAVREKTMVELARLGLAALAGRYPSSLSGGERQRVAIARALVTEPSLLLMDEPFAALDLAVRGQMEQFLLAECTRRALTLVMITHDIDEAVLLGEKILCYDKEKGGFVLLDNAAAGQGEGEAYTVMRTRLHRLLTGGII